MTTNAFSSGITVSLGDAASPEVFTAIEEAFDISGLGETKELVEATHFASGGSKEYIAGLADGDEFTISCNKVQGATQQAAMRTAAGATRNFQVAVTDGTTAETYAFAGVILGWGLGPAIGDRNTIEFTVKISGGITIS